MAHLYLLCRVVDGKGRGPCKIGTTKDISGRLRALQTGSPYPLKYYEIWDEGPGAEKFEAMVHADLSSKRMVGEWFEIEPEEARQHIEDFIRLKLSEMGLGAFAAIRDCFGNFHPIRSRENATALWHGE